MSNTPKPFAPKGEGGDVIPLEKRRPRREREGTVEYDRKSGETRIPGSLRRDETPTDRMTIPDGLPPGEAQEIVVDLTELAPVQKNPVDALEMMTFVAGALIRDKSLARGPVYYEILSGVAIMADRELGKGSFIGLVEFVEVSAKTPLRVRVYDLPKVAESGDATLLLAVQGRLFAASAELANLSMRENVKLRERVDEYDAVLRGKLDEIRERFIRPLREEIAAKNEYIARLEKDRLADSQSLVLILDDFEELVEEGVLDASEVRIAEVVSIFEPTLTAMSTCGDNAIMTKAMKALGELHAFKMKQPAKVPIGKKPAT